MTNFRTIADLRRDYGELSLSEVSVANDPIEQFQLWFNEVSQNEQYDPNSMVLSTVDEQGFPDSRVVLLKGLEENAFIFYSNYQSAKAKQLQHQPFAALNFYWPHMARQVRVRGKVVKVSREQSDNYFSSRPIMSQYSAIISPQSEIIPERSILEHDIAELAIKQDPKTLVRPEYWGGFKVVATIIEFWQGRDNRVHDRIQYQLKKGCWEHYRLAP